MWPGKETCSHLVSRLMGVYRHDEVGSYRPILDKVVSKIEQIQFCL